MNGFFSVKFMQVLNNYKCQGVLERVIYILLKKIFKRLKKNCSVVANKNIT